MSNQIPKGLLENLSEGNCVLFIGSGLSIGCGLPGWNKMVAPLWDELGKPETTNLLEIAQVYQHRFGRQRLLKKIVQQLEIIDVLPSRNHFLISQLGVKTFVTTNYDDLLEKTFVKNKLLCSKIVLDQDFPYQKSNSIVLIKLHGDLEQKDSIIITRNDYLGYNHNHPLLKQKLATLLAEKIFVFVGYSLRDIDFLHLQNEMAEILLSNAPKSYAILDDVNEFDQDCLNSLNILPVDLKLWGNGDISQRLSNFLEELLQQLSLYRSITKFSYRGIEAKNKVPERIMRKRKKVYTLIECVEFLIYSRVFEAGQYYVTPPGWEPYVTKISPETVLEHYTREDDEGNVFAGLAVFDPK